MKNRRFWFILCCALALAIGVGATWALWPAPQQAPAVKPSSQDDYPELPFPPNIHYRTPDLAMVVNDATLIVHATVDEVGASIGKLEPLALTGDEAAYLAACKTARLQLQHIRSNEEVSFLNVF